MDTTDTKELREKLFYRKVNAFEKVGEEELDRSYAYAEAYKLFLDCAKTEREAVKYAVGLAEEKGFAPYAFGDELTPGGKYYYNNRGKSLYMFRIGTESPENGVYITAAHVDSPRLDIKPNPLYEDNGMGFLKTHYYGGIKKYQWTTVPLALHGVVSKKDGTTIDVTIGEEEDEPVFLVNDLPIHLAAEQMKKALSEGVSGEELNVVIGSEPYHEESGNDAVKLNLLKILYDKYGMTEEDFLSAELTAVPAYRARDIGLDRSLISGYGHDDRVCAYPSITSLLDLTDTKKTVMSVIVDKEEIGSDGVSGMKNLLFDDLMNEIALAAGANIHTVRAKSKCLSADVCAAFDPCFASAFELRNSAPVNCGLGVQKYTGARGKGSTSEACPEFVAEIREIFDRNGVVWQTAELGRIDLGGGGTVAKYVANLNIDTLDVGVPVLSMHAPCEMISKLDLYMTYKAFSAFYRG